MRFFALRHVPSGYFMPATWPGFNGRGYTHWRPVVPENAPGTPDHAAKHGPRLFSTRRAAANAQAQWVRGALIWGDVPVAEPEAPAPAPSALALTAMDVWNAQTMRAMRERLDATNPPQPVPEVTMRPYAELAEQAQQYHQEFTNTHAFDFYVTPPRADPEAATITQGDWANLANATIIPGPVTRMRNADLARPTIVPGTITNARIADGTITASREFTAGWRPIRRTRRALVPILGETPRTRADLEIVQIRLFEGQMPSLLNGQMLDT